jgi:hypothetical protein
MRLNRFVLVSAIATLATSSALRAQWVHEPIKGAPRQADGTINMTAPAPRRNGIPDLSGIWQVRADPRPSGPGGLGESGNSKYFRDVLSDYKPGQEPLTTWGLELLHKNLAGGLALSPPVNCLPDALPRADVLPEPFKVIQSPDLIILLYEVGTTFRQIFLDGRKHPTDPVPSWNGYSVGRWENETLVVDTVGFNDKSWLDAKGTGHSEDLRLEERFHRRDFGHVDLTITLSDPKTFTKPISINVVEELMPDTDLIEHYCLENEKDGSHAPNK